MVLLHLLQPAAGLQQESRALGVRTRDTRTDRQTEEQARLREREGERVRQRKRERLRDTERLRLSKRVVKLNPWQEGHKDPCPTTHSPPICYANTNTHTHTHADRL